MHIHHSAIVAACLLLAITSTTIPTVGAQAPPPAPAPQIPFIRNNNHRHKTSLQSPLPPPPQKNNIKGYQSKKHKLQLQHIFAHGAPGAKSSKVFRRLKVDDETRAQMVQLNSMNNNSPGSNFQHTLSDTIFSSSPSSSDIYHDTNDNNLWECPSWLPWCGPPPGSESGEKVPDAKNHETVVSMVRMALDCYVDPKRQGWVDIGDEWDVETEIGWLEAGLRGYVFASEDNKTVVI
ncbi:putative lipase atg15, partial [Podila humilis]